MAPVCVMSAARGRPLRPGSPILPWKQTDSLQTWFTQELISHWLVQTGNTVVEQLRCYSWVTPWYICSSWFLVLPLCDWSAQCWWCFYWLTFGPSRPIRPGRPWLPRIPLKHTHTHTVSTFQCLSSWGFSQLLSTHLDSSLSRTSRVTCTSLKHTNTSHSHPH